MGRATNFLDAAEAVAELVGRIPSDGYDAPGLGEWNLRALVGHTSRAMVTLIEYCSTKGTFEEEVPTPQHYYAKLDDIEVDHEGIFERGVAAGAALGPDPAATFAALYDQSSDLLQAVDLDRVVPTALGAMRIRSYLPTRTFELVVHGGDIARATGLAFECPPGALAESVTLAARIAVTIGHGEPLLRALTGRGPLPDDVRVV